MRANVASIILLSALGSKLASAQTTPACLNSIIGTVGYVHSHDQPPSLIMPY